MLFVSGETLYPSVREPIRSSASLHPIFNFVTNPWDGSEEGPQYVAVISAAGIAPEWSASGQGFQHFPDLAISESCSGKPGTS